MAGKDVTIITRGMIPELLKDLGDGVEINWDIVPYCIERGVLAREEVMPYLKQCLRKSIPRYERELPHNPAFWQPRLDEARQALADIHLNQTVTYRGKSI